MGEKSPITSDTVSEFRRYDGQPLKNVPCISREWLMPFGKWKGTRLGDVPLPYLEWLLGQARVGVEFPELAAWVRNTLDDRRRTIELAAREWTRDLAKRRSWK